MGWTPYHCRLRIVVVITATKELPLRRMKAVVCRCQAWGHLWSRGATAEASTMTMANPQRIGEMPRHQRWPRRTIQEGGLTAKATACCQCPHLGRGDLNREIGGGGCHALIHPQVSGFQAVQMGRRDVRRALHCVGAARQWAGGTVVRVREARGQEYEVGGARGGWCMCWMSLTAIVTTTTSTRMTMTRTKIWRHRLEPSLVPPVQ